MIITAKSDLPFLAAVTHEKVGHTGQGLWHHKGMQLPAYIQHIANDLIQERGMPESQAIATAVSRCKMWCAGGGGVNPDTKAKACAAVAEWEKLKTQAAAPMTDMKGEPEKGPFGMKMNHPACPTNKPHAVTDNQGDAMSCHATPAEAKQAMAKMNVKMKTAAGPQLPALVTIPDVEILAAGTWQLSSGRQTFTRKDLKAAVEAARCPAVGNPVIKIGHLDKRFTPADGEPALGKVANMRLDKSGLKVVGDLAGMPGWLASISASAFPRRSVEGSYGFKCQIGHQHPFVISALALLGVTRPGVGVLSDLKDLTHLFYHAASRAGGEAWRTGPIEHAGGTVPVTEEDVRRAYYAGADVPQSWWITELQMDPSQLIVTDGEGGVYRVPFAIQGSSVSFGDAEAMESYADLAASRGSGPVMVFASEDESRDVSAADDGLDESWDGDLEDLPDLNGLDVADFEAADGGSGPVASADELEAAAKLGTGGRFAALKSALARKGAKNPGALAAWIGRKKYGKKKFGSLASKARRGAAHAAADHGSYTGKHTHAHPAYGSQGGDEMHEHEHSHSGDSVHEHDHGTQAGSGDNEGGSDVEFTDEEKASLRAAWGLADDEEITPQVIVRNANKRPVSAAARLPEGVIAIDKERWELLNQRVKSAEDYQTRQRIKERDQVIAGAIRDGKFSAARKQHWTRLWDADPDGTREVLAGLQKNVVPVSDIGAAGGNVDDELLEDEYKSLFPPGSARS